MKPVLKVDSLGNKRWYNSDGQLHREDGPAVITNKHVKLWYYNGKLHREDGPAIDDGDSMLQAWYYHGNLHRLDGPAMIGPGRELYCIHGVQYDKHEFEFWAAMINKKDEY